MNWTSGSVNIEAKKSFRNGAFKSKQSPLGTRIEAT